MQFPRKKEWVVSFATSCPVAVSYMLLPFFSNANFQIMLYDSNTCCSYILRNWLIYTFMIGSITYSAIANVLFEVALIMLSFPPQYCAQIRNDLPFRFSVFSFMQNEENDFCLLFIISTYYIHLRNRLFMGTCCGMLRVHVSARARAFVCVCSCSDAG